MKITGTSSYIRVELEGKVVIIQGEMIVNGFVAFRNSITNWEPPFQNIPISDIEKQEIIESVISESQGKNFKILFE